LQQCFSVAFWPSHCSNPCDTLACRLAPDSASVAGLLHVRKLPSLGALAAPAPQAELHLVRYKRKRMVISPVEMDPDAEAEAQGAKPAGGAPCGSAKASSALQF